MTNPTIAVLPESHVDHAVSPEQLAWLLAEAAAAGAFDAGYFEHPHVVCLTFELPEELGTVPCGLHGPEMGDEPVLEAEVTRAARGARGYESRLCARPARQVRSASVITGPHGPDAPLVLYTCFGGPVAPREPLDPTVSEGELRRSEAFWAEHALSAD